MVRKDFNPALELCKGATSLIDMGAGHCLYSMAASRIGYKCLAIDGRTDRVPNYEDISSAERFEFKKADVIDVIPKHDIVLLSGILYHLDLGQQIKLLANIKNSPAKYIILNTHYLILNKRNYPVNELKHKFSSIFKSGSIQGVNYTEGSIDSLKNRPLASLYNPVSFWHTELSLINFIEQSTGMKLIKRFEPFVADRGFFVFGLK